MDGQGSEAVWCLNSPRFHQSLIEAISRLQFILGFCDCQGAFLTVN